MNIKKVFGSTLTIGVVLAVAVAATSSYFSDTESSLGNTFVAGSIDLLIDSEAHYAGLVCVDGTWQYDNEEEETSRPDLLGQECTGSWESTDLDTLISSAFFNYDDIKPGDEGENTISITVEDNDAWLCMNIDNMQDLDNTLTEPEEDADPDGLDSGELAENLHFTAWLDQGETPGFQNDEDPGEGDNIWQGEDAEPLLFSNESGPASDVLGGKTYALADAGSIGGPIAGGITHYIGLQWCAGTMTINAGEITCDGASMGNETQTDSLTADIHIYAEQSRNNPEFSCDDVQWPAQEPELIVTEGAPELTGAGGARFRSFGNTGGEELYVGIHDLGVAGNRSASNLTWSSPGTQSFSVSYDTGTDDLTGTVGATIVVYNDLSTNLPGGCTIPGLNTMHLQVVARDDDTTVEVDNLEVDGLPAVGSFLSVGNSDEWKDWTITGADFTDGFTITGDINLTGAFGISQELSKVQILVGCI